MIRFFAYLKSLIDKTEHFIMRIRWKAFFYDRDNPVRDQDAAEVDDSEPEDDGSETSTSDEEELQGTSDSNPLARRPGTASSNHLKTTFTH